MFIFLILELEQRLFWHLVNVGLHSWPMHIHTQERYRKESRKDHFILCSKKETQSGFDGFPFDLRLNKCSVFNSARTCSKVKYSLLKGSVMEKEILVKNSFHFQEIRLNNEVNTSVLLCSNSGGFVFLFFCLFFVVTVECKICCFPIRSVT